MQQIIRSIRQVDAALKTSSCAHDECSTSFIAFFTNWLHTPVFGIKDTCTASIDEQPVCTGRCTVTFRECLCNSITVEGMSM